MSSQTGGIGRTMARWDSPSYQRIAATSGLVDGVVEVSFANGDTVSVDLADLLNPAPPNGAEVIRRDHDIIVRSPNEDDRYISWLAIRAQTDAEFSGHLRSAGRDEQTKIGLALRRLRKARGLSSKDVARRAGISAQSMSRIELGHHDVVFSTLRKILGAMGCSLADLANEDSPGGESKLSAYGKPLEKQDLGNKAALTRGGEPGMTKQQFVDNVAKKSGLNRTDAATAVDAFLSSVQDALKSGDDVVFTGFGKFSVQKRAARIGVNPRNPGQKVQIPEAMVPKFSAGSALKQALAKSSR